MAQPLVSVVLTLYNNEDFIAGTIRSVQTQTWENWEMIIVDDASTDSSAQIAEGFTEDPRIRVIRLAKNGQVSEAHNTGDREAKGDYIAPLDSDDLWDPEKLAKQVAYMEAHPEAGACLTLLKVINEKDEETESPDLAQIFRAENRTREAWLRELMTTGNHLANDSALIRREAMEAAGENDPLLIQLHDYDIWVRILLKYDIHVIQEPLLSYRKFERSGSLSAASKANRRRLYFEYSYVIGRTIREMDGELFRRVFRGDMWNPEAATAEEILCEKALLLSSDTLLTTEMTMAFELFEEIFRDPEKRRAMEEQYGVTQHDVYRLTGKKVYLDWAAEAETAELNARLIDMSGRYRQAAAAFDETQRSFSWRITAPLRKVTGRLKAMSTTHPSVYRAMAVSKTLVLNGPKAAAQRRRDLKRSGKRRKQAKDYYVSQHELDRQRKEKFSKEILFSIPVPVYNTPKDYLTEMIESVLRQSYPRWELLLADGSDAEHAYVREICESYAQKDSRIRYRKLSGNGGISENTNAALAMAKGEYIGLLDHDDLLHPCALYEYMKAICGQEADFLYSDENTFHKTPKDAYFPHHKPDYAPDTLRSYNYICHFTAFRRSLMEKAGGGFRKAFDGSQDYDLILRLTEKAEHIVHIPMILYYWRGHENSTGGNIGAKPYIFAAAKKALNEHLTRIGLKGEALDSRLPSTYRIRYEIEGKPLISILIPNMDHISDLQKCIDSIRDRSSYDNWEIVVIENNSREEQTFRYYKELERDRRIRIVTWDGGEFNYSAINNYGAREARGEYLLLLNNDVEVITPDWMEQMLMFAQRPDVGATGAMLYYPDETVQHAGVILGVGGVGGHAHKFFPRGDGGYVSRLSIAQNLTAVTAACMLLRRDVWKQVGGMDEGFRVAFNDVDFCMRIRQAGYLIVWTPYAELYHYESKSRGEEDNPEKQARFKGEIDRFTERWQAELDAGDPYYNPNLTLKREDFSLRDD